MRLALYDEGGRTETYPYSEPFFRQSGFFEKHAYDRFWDEDWTREKVKSNQKEDIFTLKRSDKLIGYSNQTSTDVRFFYTGYSFLVIGDAENGFFKDYLVNHFKEHYFFFGVILNFHRASLITFKDRISHAVKILSNSKKCDKSNQEEFQKKVQLIQKDLLDFTHRYWFTEISPQLQGQELFENWRTHLKTPILYEQVKEEITNVNQVLDTQEQAEQTRQANNLARGAALGFPLALIVGWFATPYYTYIFQSWIKK